MARIKAYAKVNLALRVHAKRSGERLHRIDSVFVLHKDIFDEIEVKKDAIDRVVFSDSSIPSQNTVVSSLFLFKKAFHVTDCYSIHVVKNIPIGAGLGGGSADAGLVLRWLGQKYAVPVSKLMSLALKIGSDVPFFVSAFQCARVTGFGGIVREVNSLWKLEKVIQKPFVCLTKRVYEVFGSLEKKTSPRYSIGLFLQGKCDPFNDLQDAFLFLYPDMVSEFHISKEEGKKTILCGSGSSIAVLFRT